MSCNWASYYIFLYEDKYIYSRLTATDIDSVSYQHVAAINDAISTLMLEFQNVHCPKKTKTKPCHNNLSEHVCKVYIASCVGHISGLKVG